MGSKVGTAPLISMIPKLTYTGRTTVTHGTMPTSRPMLIGAMMMPVPALCPENLKTPSKAENLAKCCTVTLVPTTTSLTTTLPAGPMNTTKHGHGHRGHPVTVTAAALPSMAGAHKNCKVRAPGHNGKANKPRRSPYALSCTPRLRWYVD